MKFLHTNDGVIAAMLMTSPAWLPIVREVSDVAAILLPLVGLPIALLTLAMKWRDWSSGKPDDDE